MLLPDVLSLAITREYKIFQELDGMCLTVYLPCAHVFHYKHTQKESHITTWVKLTQNK